MSDLILRIDIFMPTIEVALPNAYPISSVESYIPHYNVECVWSRVARFITTYHLD